MILLWMSAFANEVSFYLHHDVQPEIWINQQSFAEHVFPMFSNAQSSRLQQKGSSSITLRNMLVLRAASNSKIEQLRLDPDVQWVSVRNTKKPPPPMETPDLVPMQEYLYPNPGMDILSFWEEGYTGQYMNIVDIEYGWGLFHEDIQGSLWNLNPEYLPHSDVEELGYEDHGTAVLGLLSAEDNGFGCTGIAHQAQVELITEYPQEGWDRSLAMARAIEHLDAGDILLLEMQDYGHCETWSCLVPAEINPEVWSMTRFAVDVGIVVVAAAGNGIQDLDDEWYEENYLALGDSGAIIVGAGMSDIDHSWGLLNYGSRINVQAWGYDVTTLGLETLEELNHDPLRSYTYTFSGTSASSALVAGALTLLQEWSLDQLGITLEPEGLRQLIHDSGDFSIDYVPHINIVQARELLLESDHDGDGYWDWYYGGRDCNDDNPDIHPGVEDDWYDGIDQNCDGKDDFDQDEDGFSLEEDCDDSNPEIHPDAEDFWYDGIDQNCDGKDDFDQDEDGFSLEKDCDDEDADIHPHSEEIHSDGVDQDCDGEDINFLGCQTQSESTSFWWMLIGMCIIRTRK